MISDEFFHEGLSGGEQFNHEYRVIKQLKEGLPKSWAMLVNVLLPAHQRNNAPDETDVILIGPPGVYSVEIKWWTGEVSGSYQEAFFAQRRTVGTVQSNPSPIKAAKTKSSILFGLLKKGMPQIWHNVFGVVIFPPRCPDPDGCVNLSINNPLGINLPVLYLNDAVGYFKDAEAEAKKKYQERHYKGLLDDAQVAAIFHYLSESRRVSSHSNKSMPKEIGGYVLEELMEENEKYRVFRAHSTLLPEDKCIVKELLVTRGVPHTEARDILELLLREARSMAALRGNPNILQVFTPVSYEDAIYVGFEYVEGHTLREILQTGEYDQLELLRDVMLPVIDAIGVAHNTNILHRGLRPEIVLIAENKSVRIADFSLSRQYKDEEMGKLFSKFPNLSPYDAFELSQGTNDARADVYSLGAICYEILTGKPPEKAVMRTTNELTFDSQRRDKHQVSVSAAIQDIVTKALLVRPERRYETAREMHVALQEALTQQSMPGTSTPNPENVGTDPDQ